MLKVDARYITSFTIITLSFLSFSFCQQTCLNGGVLVSRPAANVEEVCLCNKNFIGQRCETSLVDMRPEEKLRYGCELRPCWIGSTCEDRGGSFVCHCSANTFGDFCEKSSLTATDPCLSKPCYNYGTCIQQDQNSYSCACNASYGGLGCKQNLVGACASNPCQRDGICVPIGLNDYRCQCPEWTIGKNCEVVFNPCQRVNCMNNGICLKRRTLAFECNCTSDYTGILCDQPKSESCLTRGCAAGQCLLNQEGKYQCFCNTPGYEGQYCEVEKCNPKCKYGYCNRDSSGNYYCQCATSTYRGPSCSDLVCFSGETLVETRERGTLKISELKKGDYIKTFDKSSNKWIYSRFVTYLHEDKNIVGKYIRLSTSMNKSLTISPLHFIARLKHDSSKIEFVFAKDINLNDRLISENDDSEGFEYEYVIKKDEVYENGAYAPLTEAGTISVNSILASCYSNTFMPELAHYLLQPIIFLSKFFNIDFLSSKTSESPTQMEISGVKNIEQNTQLNGIFWYCKFFLDLLAYIPFSSYIVYF